MGVTRRRGTRAVVPGPSPPRCRTRTSVGGDREDRSRAQEGTQGAPHGQPRGVAAVLVREAGSGTGRGGRPGGGSRGAATRTVRHVAEVGPVRCHPPEEPRGCSLRPTAWESRRARGGRGRRSGGKSLAPPVGSQRVGAAGQSRIRTEVRSAATPPGARDPRRARLAPVPSGLEGSTEHPDEGADQ